ncbi:MAG: amino acid ABC transporter substrate-binding protein [Acidimicrobiia bacterium]|nr:amino acid ABC transporter substrate-binding protein [Acidimicrobiia bacterium]
MRTSTWTRFLVLLLAFAMLAAACGDGDGDTAASESCDFEELNLVTPGVLTVATGDPAFPPWVGTTDGDGFDDPTSKLGFEAGVVYAIAAELGFADADVTWLRTGFNEAIAPGPKDWDFNLQQYSITADREEIVDFSAPYYVTRQALVTYPDSPYAGATSTDDLKDAILGAAIGTTSLDFIEEVIKPDTDPNVYDENVDLEAAMNAGQIDGLVVDLPAAYFITAVQVEGSIIAGQFEAEAAAPDEYGLLFADGNPLVGCVNAALEELKDSGKLQELEDTYLTQGGGIPTISD